MLANYKVTLCYDHFTKLKQNLLTSSQILIRYHWLKYKKRKMLKPKPRRKQNGNSKAISPSGLSKDNEKSQMRGARIAQQAKLTQEQIQQIKDGNN